MAQYPILRISKGTPLTYAEMDGNLSWLAANLNGDPNVYITGSSVNITGSTNIIGSTNIVGNLTVRGTGSFDVLLMNYFSSSILYSSGSTKFGDTADDTHQYTGSVTISGSFILPRVGSVSSYLSPFQGYFTYVTASGGGEGAWQYTNTYGWVQLLHTSSSISASQVIGLATDRIVAGAVTASVSTNISSSFRVTNGANTIHNVDHVGRTWIGNGTYTNAGYQLDVVNGNARINGIQLGIGNGTVTSNTALGLDAMYLGSVTGIQNTAIGRFSLRNLNTGEYNTAIGADAMANLTNGARNTSIGVQAGNISTGANNTVLGAFAGTSINAGNNNIFVGYTAGYVLNGVSNVLSINSKTLTDVTEPTDAIIYGVQSSNLTNQILRLNARTGVGLSADPVSSAQFQIDSTARGFLPTRTNSTASITSPVQGLLTFITASGGGEGLWQFTTGSGWVQLLHFSSSISASQIIGLSTDRIVSGGTTASVSTNISSSFRLTSGSNTLFNIDALGRAWAGNGTAVNAGYQLDVKGNLRAFEQVFVGKREGIDGYIGIGFDNFTPAVGVFSSVGALQTNLLQATYSPGIGVSILGGVGNALSQSFVVNVNSSMSFDGITIKDNTGNLTSSAALNFFSQARGFDARYTARISSTNNTVSPFTVAYPDLRFWTGDTNLIPTLTEAMRIDSRQALLIGTTGSVSSSILTLGSTTRGFLPTRTNSTASIINPVQGLMTFITASGGGEGLWQFTSGSGWVQMLHFSSSISASQVIGLSLDTSRIVTGSVTASVSTNVSASFRVVSSGSTLLNVDHVGRTWIGAGTAVNAGYQLDVVNGDARINTINVGLGAGSVSTNTALGFESLKVNSGSAGNNTGLGYRTLWTNVTGGSNTAVGFDALLFTNGVSNNTAVGTEAGRGIGGNQNVAIGAGAMRNLRSGDLNTAVGYQSLNASGPGQYNTTIGAYSGLGIVSGSNNTALGIQSLGSNSNGSDNVAVGYQALYNAGAPSRNTAIGMRAGWGITAGQNNIQIGYYNTPGDGITTGSFNTIIGGQIAGLDPGLSNNVILGDGSGNMRLIFNSSGNGYIGAVATYPTFSLSRLTIVGSGITSASNTLLLQNSASVDLFRVRDNGQQVISSPTMVLSSSNSGYLISQSLSPSGSVPFSRLTAVNITPTFFSNAASQTEIALRVAPTFTGSYTGSLMSNVIVDFGTTTSGSILLIDDVVSGSVYAVNDFFGLPVFEIFSDAQVNMYDYPYAVFNKSGSYLNLGLPSTLAVDSAVNMRADMVMDEGLGFSTRTTQGNGTTLNDSTASLYTLTFGAQSGSVFMSAVVTGYDSASRDMISGEVKSSIRYRANTATIVGTNFRLINSDNPVVGFDIAVSSNTAVLRAYGTGSRTYIWGATITTQII